MLDIDIFGMLGPVLKGVPKARRIVGALLKTFATVATGVVERFLGGTRDGETFMRTEEELFRATAALCGQITAGTLAAAQQDTDWLEATSAQSRARLKSTDTQRHAGIRGTVAPAP